MAIQAAVFLDGLGFQVSVDILALECLDIQLFQVLADIQDLVVFQGHTDPTVYPSAGIANSTGTAWGTSYATSGANSIVLRVTNQNISANSIIEGFSNVAAAGTTTTLTVASSPNYVVTGSGGQTYKLPDATTLPNGVNYTFNNNQSSGTIVVTNNS